MDTPEGWKAELIREKIVVSPWSKIRYAMPMRSLRKQLKDLHVEIAEAVKRSAFEPGWHTPERQTVFHTAFNAWASYDAHILGYRVSGTVVCHVTGLSPWQLCQLFGEMIDAGITNVGQGERFFNQMRPGLLTRRHLTVRSPGPAVSAPVHHVLSGITQL
ncbi:hypothetical protein [Streptomyces sp. V4I2]|uniref:hypothetical protein n=1 Tax=Streptomyces sp. V4I2 TaxID=3042280 RepID=UPI00277D9B32|nr:hypothetical protein [Streptomyces sp. V4I2]MDQ1051907.1 hypothetical protein [Streptomyces sp. V4I2]